MIFTEVFSFITSNGVVVARSKINVLFEGGPLRIKGSFSALCRRCELVKLDANLTSVRFGFENFQVSIN